MPQVSGQNVGLYGKQVVSFQCVKPFESLPSTSISTGDIITYCFLSETDIQITIEPISRHRTSYIVALTLVPNFYNCIVGIKWLCSGCEQPCIIKVALKPGLIVAEVPPIYHWCVIV